MLTVRSTARSSQSCTYSASSALRAATLALSASSVLAGLSAAADAGARWGADPAQVEKWKRAAVALRAGILKRIEDDRTLDRGGWRGLQWTLFPAPVFESYADPAADKLIQRLSKDFRARRGYR